MYEHITTAMVTARIRALGLTFTPEQIREKQVFLTVRMVEMSPLGACPSFAREGILQILDEDESRALRQMLIVRKNSHRRDGFELQSPQTGWGLPMSFRLGAGQPRGAVQLFNQFQDSIYARIERNYQDRIAAGVRPENITCRNFKLGLVLETGPPNPREHIGREANENIPRYMLISRVFMNPYTDRHQREIPDRILNPERHTAVARGEFFVDPGQWDSPTLSADEIRRLLAPPRIPMPQIEQQVTWNSMGAFEETGTPPVGYRVSASPISIQMNSAEAQSVIGALQAEFERLRLDRTAEAPVSTATEVAEHIDTPSEA